MNKEKTVKNLIIGAGLSGLSFAYFSHDDDYLILEQEDTPGGYCRTIPNSEYVWDYAGHFYHFQTERYRKLFLSLIEEDEIVRQIKNTKIYYKGNLVDYPFQANIHELDKDEFIECLCDLYFRQEAAEYDSFLEMLYVKFGRAITDKFLKPYNEKLYATNLNNLDKDAMGRFFPYVDFEQVMQSMRKITKKTYNDSFLYLKKGTGYFIRKLYQLLDKEKILFNTEVVSVNQSEKYVQTRDGQKIYYENLINTAPFNGFLKLLNEKSMSDFSNSLSYNKVLVLNLGFDKSSPIFQKEHWVYFPQRDLNFYRIGFYNNILNQERLSVYIEIGFPKDVQVDDIDVEKELRMALAGMKKVGIINDDMKLVDKSVLLMDPAYVHIESKTLGRVEKTIQDLEKDNIYCLGRYGRWTYNSMEDCMGLADQLAEKL